MRRDRRALPKICNIGRPASLYIIINGNLESRIMKLEDFTLESRAYNVVRKLKLDNIPDKQFSDVIDPQGHQYIDLVLEGGGVLGIALVGYTYVLEQMGLRFRGIAGTSAGAINALLLAAHKTPSHSKSEHSLEHLGNQNLYEFVDGPPKVRKFIDCILQGKSKWKIAYHGLRIIDHMKTHQGLNPGDRFKEWITDILKLNNTETTEQLRGQFALPDDLLIREGVERSLEGLRAKLVLIASDITTESRIQFPAMADLYWEEPGGVNPAEYVRASMSIPGFFYPQRIRIGDMLSAERRNKWIDKVKFTGPPPEEAVFVDGGIVSNFPIDVFHSAGVPRLPTFGVKLGSDREQTNRINRLGSYGLALFNTARHIHDYEFILRNPDYSHLVSSIDVGDHNWLNFSISDEDKIDLFERGAEAADYFLRNFDWNEYKKIRARI